jgi:hypothetical protein
MELLRQVITLIIQHPWIALLIGGALLGFALSSASKGAAWCALPWFLYCVYEYGMRLRLLCSGDCAIRIDILVIYPVLAALTLLGVILGLVKRQARR